MSLPKLDDMTFQVEVPSTKEKITMRLMKVKDENLLLMAKESNEPSEILGAMKTVVSNCIVEEGIDLKNKSIDFDKLIDIDKLTRIDLEYLFLQLRDHSVSEIAQTI